MDKAPGWYDDPETPGLKFWWTGTAVDKSRVLRAPGAYVGEGVPGGKGYWTGTSWEAGPSNTDAKVSLRSVVIVAIVVVALIAGAVAWRVGTATKPLTAVTLNVQTETPHSAQACAQAHSLYSSLSQLGPLTFSTGANVSAQVSSYGTQGLLASENALSALGGYSSSVEGLSPKVRTELSKLSGYLAATQKDFSVLPVVAAKAARLHSQWSKELSSDVLAAEVAARSVSAHSAVVAGLLEGCPA
jgi:hypothetical protein